MKRILVVALTVATMLCPAAAQAAPPTNAQLSAQLKALTTRTAKLEKQAKKLQTDLAAAQGVGSAALVFAVCGAALTADALQGTWAVIDQLGQPTGKIFFGPQVPLNDQGVCTALGVTRSQGVPPNISPFSALLQLLAPARAGLLTEVLSQSSPR